MFVGAASSEVNPQTNSQMEKSSELNSKIDWKEIFSKEAKSHDEGQQSIQVESIEEKSIKVADIQVSMQVDDRIEN